MRILSWTAGAVKFLAGAAILSGPGLFGPGAAAGDAPLVLAARPAALRPDRVVLHQRQSAYFDILVEQDDSNLRHLVFLPRYGTQTVIDPDDPARPISAYLKYMFLSLPALGRPPERILFIGLGGGIMPTILRKYFPEAKVDIVEVDPAVFEIAKTYFYFRPDERATTVHIADGRAFLKRNETRYDLIFLDAYNAEAIPFHLTTKEFYQLMGSRLTPGGVIAVNSAELARKDFNGSSIRTVRSALAQLAVYRNEAATNYIFLCANDNQLDLEKMKAAAAELDRRVQAGFVLSDLVGRRLTEETIKGLPGKAMVLTDDFAPVDHLDAK